MKAHTFHCEDGSTLFEWVSPRHRFGITIEQNPDESGWYFVTKDTDTGPFHGPLPDELLDMIKSAPLWESDQPYRLKTADSTKEVE